MKPTLEKAATYFADRKAALAYIFPRSAINDYDLSVSSGAGICRAAIDRLKHNSVTSFV